MVACNRLRNCFLLRWKTSQRNDPPLRSLGKVLAEMKVVFWKGVFWKISQTSLKNLCNTHGGTWWTYHSETYYPNHSSQTDVLEVLQIFRGLSSKFSSSIIHWLNIFEHPKCTTHCVRHWDTAENTTDKLWIEWRTQLNGNFSTVY